MGFGVTAGHVILFIALLGGISGASAVHWSNVERLDDARRAQAAMHEETAQSNLTLVGAPVFNVTAGTFVIEARNAGAVTLRLGHLDVVADGQYVTPLVSYEVDGVATTDLWLPGEVLTITYTTTEAPDRIRLVAGNGASMYYAS